MAATTTILIDTDNRTVVMAQNVFAASTQETDIAKFTAQDKKGQIWAITVDMTGSPANAGFRIGELVTSNDSKTGYVLDWNATTGIVRVVAADSGQDFSSSTSLTGGTSGYARNINAKSREVTRLSIKSIQYDITQGMTVTVRWVATANSDAIQLSGSGVISRDQLQTLKLKNPNAAGTTGDIAFSTLGAAANSAYTVILELQKEQGYAQRPGY